MIIRLPNNNSKMLIIAIIVIFINTVIESILLLFDDRTIIISLQFFINLTYIGYFFLRQKKVAKSKINSCIIFLILFTLGSSIFSSNVVLTFNFVLKFTIPFIYFIIGFNILKDERSLNTLTVWLWPFLIYFVLYILTCNLFSLGESLYRGGMLTGYYSLSGIYVPCFTVLVILFNQRRIKNKLIRRISIMAVIFTTIVFMLMLKRTLIATIAFFYLLYFLRDLNLIKIIRLSFLSLIMILILNTLFSKKIDTFISVRESRFSKNYSIQNEGRYRENELLFDLMKSSYLKLILGSGEVFNDRAFFSDVYQISRQAHNSFIRLFWNGGLIGLGIFLIFYFLQARYMYMYFLISKKLNYHKNNLFLMGLGFILLRFVNEFSSGITYLSYNAFSYLIIGGILRNGIKLSLEYSSLKK